MKMMKIEQIFKDPSRSKYRLLSLTQYRQQLHESDEQKHDQYPLTND